MSLESLSAGGRSGESKRQRENIRYKRRSIDCGANEALFAYHSLRFRGFVPLALTKHNTNLYSAFQRVSHSALHKLYID